MAGYTDGFDQESTSNEIEVIIYKRARKYLRMAHGKCCTDNCGCCPNLKPRHIPAPNENLCIFLNDRKLTGPTV